MLRNTARVSQILPRQISLRSFSQSTRLLKKIEWMAFIPEVPTVDRLPFRAQHLQDIQSNISKGILTHGGALFTEPPKDGEPLPKFAGSLVHVMAETRDEVVKILESDIYHKSGAWDTKNAVIYPCAIAFSTGRNVFASKKD